MKTKDQASNDDKAYFHRPEHAKEQFLKSMNCSQAVFETYAPAMGLSTETARKIAAAFAGGMGMGSVCGAVTGAFLVIGMKYGKTVDSDPQADSETFKRTTEFVKEFKERHKYLNCSALIGVDMGKPKNVEEASRKGLFTTRCPVYVKTAADVLDKVLA